MTLFLDTIHPEKKDSEEIYNCFFVVEEISPGFKIDTITENTL